MAETVTAVQVVDMIDAMGVDASRIPAGIKRVAIYLTGSGGIAWTNADVATLVKNDPQLQLVYRIVQANNPADVYLQVATLIIDIEPGAATLPVAISIAKARAAHGLRTVFYFFRAEEATIRATVSVAGLDAWIDYWAAYWELDHAGASACLGKNGIVAVQWASSSTNPHTLVPGTKVTLRQANVDLSVTLLSWPAPGPKPKPHPIPVPHPKITAAAISGFFSAALLAFLQSKGLHITHLDATEQSLISVGAAILAGYLKKSGQTS